MILDGIVFKEIVAKTQKECTYLQRMLISAKVFELLNFDFNIFEKWMGSATFKPNITAIAYAILTLGKRVQFCKPNLVKFFSFFLNEVYSILLLENLVNGKRPTFEENLTKWVQKLLYFIFLNVCLLARFLRFRGSTLNTQILVYPKFWQKGSKLAQK